jgi:hypothetical protein
VTASCPSSPVAAEAPLLRPQALHPQLRRHRAPGLRCGPAVVAELRMLLRAALLPRGGQGQGLVGYGGDGYQAEGGHGGAGGDGFDAAFAMEILLVLD